MNVQRFNTRPTEVRAVQWDGTTDDATAIINWILSNGGSAHYHCPDPDRCAKNNGDAPHWIKLVTAEGTQTVGLNDYVVIEGWFRAYSRKDFEAKYERIPEADEQPL